MIFGVDVSVFQGLKIDYAKAATEIRFAIIKCTEGVKGLDSERLAHIDGFRKVGVRTGIYAFVHPGMGTGDEQAEILWQACGDTMPDFFAIDLEASDGHNVDDILKFVRDFVAGCEGRFGRKPLLYTGPWFVNKLGAAFKSASDLAECPLWISAYTHGNDWTPGPDDQPPKMLPWGNKWAIWQFSGGASYPGFPTLVDRDVFNGTEDDLRELCCLPSIHDDITRPSLPPPGSD